MIPIENRVVKVSPIAASEEILIFCWTYSIMAVAKIPLPIAPAIMAKDPLEVVIKYAITSPGKTAWTMASHIMDMRRSIMKEPKMDPFIATRLPTRIM